MHFIGVFNKDGGTFRTMDMEVFCAGAVQIFAEAGATLDCRTVAGEALLPELERAVADPAADAVLAGGGDGTISAAADLCFRAGKALAILPAGTMNLFARSLGIPLHLDEALKALAAGEVQAVDIGTANSRPFVHQYSVGMHTRLVRIREQLAYNSRLGKMAASLRAVVEAISRPLVFEVEIRTKRGAVRRKASAIAISNNLLGEGHVPHADSVDRGVLGVYVVKPMPPLELARLVVTLPFGAWKQHPLVSEKEVTELSLRFPRRKSSAQAVIDGELIKLDRQVDLKIHPGALKVVAPVTQAAAVAA